MLLSQNNILKKYYSAKIKNKTCILLMEASNFHYKKTSQYERFLVIYGEEVLFVHHLYFLLSETEETPDHS